MDSANATVRAARAIVSSLVTHPRLLFEQLTFVVYVLRVHLFHDSKGRLGLRLDLQG